MLNLSFGERVRLRKLPPHCFDFDCRDLNFLKGHSPLPVIIVQDSRGTQYVNFAIFKGAYFTTL